MHHTDISLKHLWYSFRNRVFEIVKEATRLFYHKSKLKLWKYLCYGIEVVLFICMWQLGPNMSNHLYQGKMSNLNSLYETHNVMRKEADWLKNGGLCGMDVFMSLRHVVTLEDPAILGPDGWVWSLDCEHHTSGREATETAINQRRKKANVSAFVGETERRLRCTGFLENKGGNHDTRHGQSTCCTVMFFYTNRVSIYDDFIELVDCIILL